MKQDQRRPWQLCRLMCVLALTLGACATNLNLAQPPNLYLDGRNYPDDLVPQVLRVVDPPIFYVTDRNVEGIAGDQIDYGDRRSDSMGFGYARVRFGAANWADLVNRTHVDEGGAISKLRVESLHEEVRFTATPLPAERFKGELRTVPANAAAYNGRAKAFQDKIRAEIKRTGNGRVLVFAHGVFTDFNFAMQTLASVWHFSGRKSTPVLFSWPAGNRGLLGYFRDREAADFSVYHAKEMLRLIAEIPEVEDIDIVAHSRGTSVITQAIREMVIFNRGKGVAPKTAMKTGTLILAAPDIDVGAFRQRFLTERVSEAFEQVNIYVNPDDTALRLSSYIAKYPRIGIAPEDSFPPGELRSLQREGLIHFIQVEGASGADSHGYFRDNPAVLSDVVLALRTRAFPGGTLRPLEQQDDTIWLLQPNYPLDRLPDLDIDLGR